MSILDQLKALDEHRAKLLGNAKSEALEKARAAVAALNELGFRYGLTEASHIARTAKALRAEGQPKRQQKVAECPICHFKTSPLHDRRSHRSQATKKPFTTAELAQKGLTIVK